MDYYRVLAIDYGTVRVGIALSDPMRIIAAPYKTIQLESDAQVINEIIEIIREQSVKEIVLGLPLNLSGEDTIQTGKTRDFCRLLKESVDLPIIWQDERFTSKESESEIRKMGLSPKQGRKIVDQIAASLILRSYLQKN